MSVVYISTPQYSSSIHSDLNFEGSISFQGMDRPKPTNQIIFMKKPCIFHGNSILASILTTPVLKE
jgi:hypothetical protein